MNDLTFELESVLETSTELDVEMDTLDNFLAFRYENDTVIEPEDLLLVGLL